MTKSQNTKNEQQKDLCITSEQLTEQWKKGELPNGYYYCLIQHNKKPSIQECWAHRIANAIGGQNDEQVLEPVPSYEEWIGVKQQRDLENKLRHDSDNENWQLRTQNAQLKDLLKEVKGKLKYINTPKNQHNIFGNDLMKKIDQALGETR